MRDSIRKYISLSVFLMMVISCSHQQAVNPSSKDPDSVSVSRKKYDKEHLIMPADFGPEYSDEELRGLTVKATNGDGKAAYALSDYYVMEKHSKGVADRYYWLKKSAEYGYPHAQYDLGRSYMHGIMNSSIQKDEELGRYWLNRAAASGGSFAAYAKIELRVQLSAEEIDLLSQSAEKGDVLDILMLILYYGYVENDSEMTAYYNDLIANPRDLKKARLSNVTSNIKQ